MPSDMPTDTDSNFILVPPGWLKRGDDDTFMKYWLHDLHVYDKTKI